MGEACRLHRGQIACAGFANSKLHPIWNFNTWFTSSPISNLRLGCSSVIIVYSSQDLVRDSCHSSFLPISVFPSPSFLSCLPYITISSKDRSDNTMSDGVLYTEESFPSVAASSSNGTNGLAEIIHQHQLKKTAAMSSSPLRCGKIFDWSNFEPRYNEERKVPSSLPTASATNPQATDPQQDVMVGWSANCGSDMGIGFFSMLYTTVDQLVPHNLYTHLAVASPNSFSGLAQQNDSASMIIQHQQLQKIQQ